ncbi:MAG: PAS domain-containing protein [Planctomycetota bacterium]|nr:MAG: PAS domain-containing protein [Planctomycetota bacterium]
MLSGKLGAAIDRRIPLVVLTPVAVAGALTGALLGPLWAVSAVAYGAVLAGTGLWLLRVQDRRFATLLDGYAEAEPAGGCGVRSVSDGGAMALLPETAARVNAIFESFRRQWEQAVSQKTEVELLLNVRNKHVRRLETVIDLLSVPVIVLDGTGHLMFWNGAAEKLLPVGEGQDADVAGLLRFAGAQTDAAMVFSTLPELVRLLAETRMRECAERRRSVEMAIPPDSDTLYRVDAAAVVDRDGELLGVVATFHDLDSVRRERAQHAEFVSSVAHELKTPMAGIKAFVEMLIDGDCEDPEEQREVLQLIDAQVDRLTRMVNSVLNLARIESGVIEIKRADVDLNDVVRKTLEIVEPVAAEKQQTLIAELSHLYLPVHVDPDLMGQAVLNLVSNAVKYTPEGGEIRLRTRPDESTVVLEVADNGIGIPQESLPLVFDRFYRVPQNERAASGTGLGLALVRYIVEDVHQGEIDVRSRVGEGTCFTVQLPLGHRRNGSRHRDAGVHAASGRALVHETR